MTPPIEVEVGRFSRKGKGEQANGGGAIWTSKPKEQERAATAMLSKKCTEAVSWLGSTQDGNT